MAQAITALAMVHVAHAMDQASVDHVTEREGFNSPSLIIDTQVRAQSPHY